MCGIAGVWRRDGLPVNQIHLQAMAAAMQHRGPDGEGIFVDGDFGLVHRRLSIVDLGGGAQPMTSSDQRWTLCYNGEVYNAAQLRQAYPHFPYQTDHSDTEAILAAHAQAGSKVIGELVGMYAYALWDSQQQSLLLTRDSVGVKPLYLYEKDNLLVFASELQALLAYPGLDLSINKAALPYYFSYLFIPAPQTIYRHIRQLMPGEILAIERRSIHSTPWQAPAFEGYQCQQEGPALEAFAEVLGGAIDRHMISDVPVGVFLSGGIDSSLVAAVTARRHGPQQAFTMGFPVKEYDEQQVAKTIADHLAFRFQCHELQPVDVDLLPQIIGHFGEPFADSSALPSYILSRFTAEQVKVVLSGEGGDELFAGYTHFRGIEWSEKYKRRMPAPVRHLLRQLVGLIPKIPVGDANFKIQRILRVLDAAEQSPLQARAQKLNVLEAGQLARLFSPEMNQLLAESDLVRQMQSVWQAADDDDFGRIVDSLCEVDLQYYLPNDMLAKMDRMSMAHGLEVRVPLLDPEVINFARRLHPSLKLHKGQVKYLPRRAVAEYLPEWITRLPKRGFNVPLDYWFKGSLSGYAREVIMSNPQQKSEFFNMAEVDRLLREHEAGHINNGNTIWSLLMFSLWLQWLPAHSQHCIKFAESA